MGTLSGRSSGRLSGKVAIITGGARGQGAEEGRLFAAEGAVVVLADVLDEEGEATAGGIDGADYVHLDVSSEAEWEAVVAGVAERHGRVDVLVNNAAVDHVARLEATALADWNRVVAINQTGVFLGLRTVATHMIRAGHGGSMVNISSVAGLEAVASRAAYASTKWAVRGLTKVAAQEWGRHGIRVNSVHPGMIETPMTAGLRAMNDPESRERLERSIPLGRFGLPADVASVVLFLASDESSYCTGQEFTVDGGIHR